MSLFNYTVTVFTGDVDNAGTDADVSITIVGEKGKFDLVQLSGDGHAFNRGSQDSFDFTVEDLGDLIQIRISHNNKDNDAWFLDRVEVATTDSVTGAERRWICPSGEWLGEKEADHKTARVLFPSNGLTGFWRADDGGYYYLRKQHAELWWAGLSPDGLQNGLTFCNVFRGTIHGTMDDKTGAFTGSGQAIQGNWAELPRGITSRAGTLSLSIELDNDGVPVHLKMTASTGCFPATTWKHVPAPSVVRDIRDVFDRVRKNQGDETLHDNLKPYKDPVCIIGTIVGDKQRDPINTNYPPKRARDYVSFICQGNDKSDGDIGFGLKVDRTLLDEIPNFWNQDGWLHTAQFIRDKLDYNNNNELHCEVVMFARTGKCEDGGSHYDPVLLPGWQEQEGNSVLINGRPLNGQVVVGVTELSSNKWPVETLAGLALPKCTRVQVTGPIVLDCGHLLGDCADEDPAGTTEGPNQEIHPVYAIDVLKPKGLDEMTGAWATFDGGTCYFLQMGTQMWGLWMRPFRDRTYAVVLNGTISGTISATGVLRLDAMDVPLGDRAASYSLLLQLSPDKIRLLDSDGKVVMEKMYEGVLLPPGPGRPPRKMPTTTTTLGTKSPLT